MKKILAAMAATAAMIVGLYYCSPYRTQSLRPVVSLRSMQVSTVQDTVTLYGTVVEKNRRQYYSEGAAEVLRCYVQEGQQVHRGDPLIKLRRIDDVQAQATVDASALQSVISLLKAGDLDGAEESLQAFAAQPMVGSGEQVYTLYSDMDGTVMRVSGRPGESISRLFPCVEISDLTQLEIQATADESTVGHLQEQQSCTIRIPAFSLSGLSGSIDRIQPYARQSGSFLGNAAAETTVCISLSSASPLLKPGYSATVRVITQVLPQVQLAPYTCVGQDENQQEYVFTIEDGRLKKHFVSTGLELEDSVELCSGVSPDALLVEYPDQYEEGTAVIYEME